MSATLSIQPGTVCVLTSELEGAPNFEMVATSNVVNSTVQFKFGDMYDWVHVSRIVGTVTPSTLREEWAAAREGHEAADEALKADPTNMALFVARTVASDRHYAARMAVLAERG